MMDNAIELPSGGDAMATLEGIMRLEQALSALPEDQRIECPLLHWFPDGLYARMILVPAGTVLTTMVHKREHLTVAIRGVCTVVGEDGGSKEVVAPQVFVTQPGTKRAVYVHDGEDVVWLTVHRCDARTVEGAEDELVGRASTVEDYMRITGQTELLEARP